MEIKEYQPYYNRLFDAISYTNLDGLSEEDKKLTDTYKQFYKDLHDGKEIKTLPINLQVQLKLANNKELIQCLKEVIIQYCRNQYHEDIANNTANAIGEINKKHWYKIKLNTLTQIWVRQVLPKSLILFTKLHGAIASNLLYLKNKWNLSSYTLEQYPLLSYSDYKDKIQDRCLENIIFDFLREGENTKENIIGLKIYEKFFTVNNIINE